jgi:WD40 repeat protein
MVWLSIIFSVTSIYPFSITRSEDLSPIYLRHILDFDVSPDGERFVTIDDNHIASVTETETGKTIFHMEAASSRTTSIISWSFDGKYIVGAFDDGSRLWDANTGNLLHLFAERPTRDATENPMPSISAVDISPDGKLLATASQQDSTIIVYDVASDNKIFQLAMRTADGDEDRATGLVFSPDSSLLAVEQLVGGVSIWNMRLGTMSYTLPGEVASFSPDGKMISTGGGRLTSNIWLWASSSGEILHKFVAPLNVVDLKWATDNNRLFGQFNSFALVDEGYSYTGEAVREWRLDINQEVGKFSSTKSIKLPAELEMNETILGISKDDLLVWNRVNDSIYRKPLSSTIPLNSFEITDKYVYSFAISDEAGRIIVGYKDKLVVYDIDTQDVVEVLPVSSAVRKIKLVSATQTALVLLADKSLITIHIKGN